MVLSCEDRIHVEQFRARVARQPQADLCSPKIAGLKDTFEEMSGENAALDLRVMVLSCEDQMHVDQFIAAISRFEQSSEVNWLVDVTVAPSLETTTHCEAKHVNAPRVCLCYKCRYCVVVMLFLHCSHCSLHCIGCRMYGFVDHMKSEHARCIPSVLKAECIASPCI